jgi:CRISPR-associated exonuclease Cas4
MVSEDTWVPISALQHFSYCPRQCALIHVEQVFEENLYTMRGQAVHRLVNEPGTVREGGLRVERALPLYSQHFGLTGKADVVEFGSDGTPYPVEYKHGSRREKVHDDIQLAAQALCLEEMTGKMVPEGAIFYHSSRRRRTVQITAKLRQMLEELIPQVRSLLYSEQLPPPVKDSRCHNCSLNDLCQPKLLRATRELNQELAGLFQVKEQP